MTTFIAPTSTHIVTTTPAENGGVAVITSIRRIMIQGILASKPKAEIEAEVIKHAPQSAAAKKFGKHYAWYKGTLKKEGRLPAQVVQQTAPTQTIAELEAQIARLKALLTALDTDEVPTEETVAEAIERKQLEMLADVERRLAEQD